MIGAPSLPGRTVGQPGFDGYAALNGADAEGDAISCKGGGVEGVGGHVVTLTVKGSGMWARSGIAARCAH